MKITICKRFRKLNKLHTNLTTAFPKDKITIKKCIDMCKVCKHQPSAKADGKKLKSLKVSGLIQRIESKH